MSPEALLSNSNIANAETVEELKPKIAEVKAMFPQKLSEAESNKLN